MSRYPIILRQAPPTAQILDVGLRLRRIGAVGKSRGLPAVAAPAPALATPIRIGNITLYPSGIIPPARRVGVAMQRRPVAIVVQADEVVTPPAGGVCTAVAGFTWTQFVAAMTVDNIEATLSNEAYDNVQLNVRLGSSIEPWIIVNPGPNDIAGYIDGAIADNGTTYEIPFALELQYGVAHYATLSFPRPDIVAVPAYAAVAANQGATLNGFNPAPFDANGLAVFPGVAVDGFDQQYWRGKTTDKTLWVEVYYTRNPNATNTEYGYSGYVAFYDNGCFLESLDDDTVIEEWRSGFIDANHDIEDPAFDTAWMRYGMITKRNGNNTDVQVVLNGVVVHTASVSGNLLLQSFVVFDVYNPPDIGAQDGYLPLRPQFKVWTNGSVAGGYLDYEEWDYYNGPGEFEKSFVAVNMACVKYASYAKPAEGNAGLWQLNPEFNLMTNPAYPLT